MKEIELTQGKVALVDDKDYEALSKFKWRAIRHGNTWYAIRTPRYQGKQGYVLMHRVILAVSPGVLVDHRDMDGLNNQRKNIRPCNRSQNSMNRHAHRDSSSGYHGVGWHRQRAKWRARIKLNGKEVSLGLYESVMEAALAYDIAARRLFGEFARTNFSEADSKGTGEVERVVNEVEA